MGPKAAYGVWEAQVVELPERSRFYSLSPVGVGTPQVESLSGYIARLAEAHVLSVGDMVGRRSTSTASTMVCKRMTSFHVRRPIEQVFHATAYAINGVSGRALKWTRILEGLTCCRHLDALTLLPLRDTLSNMFLFKRWRAWCPECYAADRDTGTVYERLLWALGGVTVCPVHVAPLEEKCSFCHKALPPLAAHSRPGHCSSCGSWLGRQAGRPRVHANPIEADYELYVATTAGELLASCSTAGRLSRARFSANLRICIDRFASGNTKAFAELTHASGGAVQSWVNGMMRPRLDVLLRVCFHLGIPAGALLTSRRLAGVNWPAATAHFPRDDRGVRTSRSSEEVRRLMKAALREDECPSVPELSRRLGYRRYERLYQVDPALCRRITARHRSCKRTHWWKQPGAKRICEIHTIRSALEQSLVQDPPVSVRRIAMQLGYANGGLIQRKFPDLCHAIARKLEDCRKRRFGILRQAVEAAGFENPPPTLHELSQRLGYRNSSTLRSWFPDETGRLLEARAIHEQREIAKRRAALLVILRGRSAPSLSSVARQIDLSVSNLAEKYPDLCRAIHARYLQCQHDRTREREQLLNEEVCRIARRLHARGQIPTELRIMSSLSEGSLKQWGAVRRAVKRARRILGLA
jgi:hypothetical protein